MSDLAGQLRRPRPASRRGKQGACAVALDGMPAVALDKPPVAPGEHIPWLFIYLPVVFKWLALAWRYRCLTLPTVANPHIAAGGFRAESKISYLRQIGPDCKGWVARSTLLPVGDKADLGRLVERAERAMAEAGFDYPLVAKPDVGACGFGVRLIGDGAALADYLAGYPADESVMLQEYLPWAGEAGIYYMRMPDEARGRIFSLGLRYFPYVVGDGRSSLRALIEADPRASRRARLHLAALRGRLDEVPAGGEIVRLALVGSLRVGALYRDGGGYVTEALSARIDEIARSMPEFCCGRFDIRFSSIEALQQGRGFRIIEVNGAGAEAIHIWDPELTLGNAYRVLFEQHEALFAISARNRERGYRPLSLRQVIALQWRESRLLRRYPASN